MKGLRIPKFKKIDASHILGWGESDYVHPVYHWTLGLFGATVLFITIGLYIALDFKQQLSIPDEPDITEIRPIDYKGNDILLYAKKYSDKEQVFNELRKNRFYTVPVSVSTTSATTSLSLE